MIICQQREFYFFSSSLIPFISFSFLITLARPSSIMLKRSIERSHPCLACDLSGKASDFSPLSMMFSGKYFFVTSWGYSPLYLVWCEFISWMGVGFRQMLFCIYWHDHIVFLWPIHVMDYINWFLNVAPALHNWDNSCWL